MRIDIVRHFELASRDADALCSVAVPEPARAVANVAFSCRTEKSLLLE
jgi:hypothetical protein